MFARLVGFTSTAKLLALGTISCSSSGPFGETTAFNEVMPVMLLSGRLRLLTIPTATGSRPISKIIGIVVVAAFAASAAAPLPAAAITLT
jgi:hypothetical protein